MALNSQILTAWLNEHQGGVQTLILQGFYLASFYWMKTLQKHRLTEVPLSTQSIEYDAEKVSGEIEGRKSQYVWGGVIFV